MYCFNILRRRLLEARDLATEMSGEVHTRDSGASTATTIVAIVATLTGVSTLFVAGRLFVRVKLRSLGLDDYLIVLAMVRIRKCICRTCIQIY